MVGKIFCCVLIPGEAIGSQILKGNWLPFPDQRVIPGENDMGPYQRQRLVGQSHGR